VISGDLSPRWVNNRGGGRSNLRRQSPGTVNLQRQIAAKLRDQNPDGPMLVGDDGV
jgi:hypothetical protein